jgi:N-acetylneuraminic acid mutarotase
MKTSIQAKLLVLGCLLLAFVTGCAVSEAPVTEPTASAEPTAIPTVIPTEIPSPTPLMIQMPVKLTWNKLADLLTPRVGHTASVVDGKIYVIGGFGTLTRVDMYDPETDSWTVKADMPTGRQWLSSSVVDGKIYAIGGATGAEYLSPSVATVEMYDPATDIWTKKAEMSTARGGLATVVVDGKIFAMGGGDYEQGSFKKVEVYDPATDTWTPHTEMLMFNGDDAVLLDGKIYATDGRYLQIYDPEIDSWSKVKGIPYGTMWPTLCPLGNVLFAFGGEYLKAGKFSTIAEINVYNPATDLWERLPEDMPIEGWLMSASEVDGKIYLIGGLDQDDILYIYPRESQAPPPPMAGVWEVTIES